MVFVTVSVVHISRTTSPTSTPDLIIALLRTTSAHKSVVMTW